MFKEFKKFIMRGNVMDLAIGVIIGAAFGKIVTSLVDDIIMPVLGLILRRVDFANLFINLSPAKGDFATLAAAKAAGAATLNYGVFINVSVQFIIVAFAIFMMIRGINKIVEKPEPAPANTKECPFCASTISIKASKCPYCASQL